MKQHTIILFSSAFHYLNKEWVLLIYRLLLRQVYTFFTQFSVAGDRPLYRYLCRFLNFGQECLLEKTAGFVQNLELLKKSGNLQTSFPDLEKVWKIKIKYGKIVKSLKYFFVLKTETSAFLLS